MARGSLLLILLAFAAWQAPHAAGFVAPGKATGVARRLAAPPMVRTKRFHSYLADLELSASLLDSLTTSPSNLFNPIVRREPGRTVRLASAEDLAPLAEHRLRIFRNIVPTASTSRTYRAIFEGLLMAMRNRFHRNGILILLCTRDDNPLAPVRGETLMGNVELSSHQFDGSLLQDLRPNVKRWYLTEMAVASAYRRRGVALSLLECAEQVAHQRGVRELLLHVDADNDAAVQLYAKAGFEMLPQTPSVVAFTRKMGLMDPVYKFKHHHLMRRCLPAA